MHGRRRGTGVRYRLIMDMDDASSNMAAPPPPDENLFLGPQGLRPGWRVLVFALLFIVFDVILIGGAVLLGLPVRVRGHELSPLLMAVPEGSTFLAALGAAGVMSVGERRAMGAYGLPLAQAFRGQFWRGALWGFAALTALLAALRATGSFDFGAVALHGSALVQAAASWAAVFVLVGFAEEYLVRGYALVTLARGVGFWPAAIILSIIFGGMHLGNTGENALGALSAGLIGLFFCFTVRRTGHLWFAVGFHFLWDYSETFLYSVPDSGMVPRHTLLSSSFHGSHWLTGGSVGPEGSLLVFPLIAILFWLFARFQPEVKFSAA